MFASFNQMAAPFTRQFEPDGDGYVFRRYQRESPIGVTAAERDRFIADFSRRFGWSCVLMTACFLALPVIMLFFAEPFAGPYGMGLMFGAIMAVIIPFMLAIFWAWGAPVRALAGRPVRGEPLSAEQVRRVKFASISYGQLIGVGLGVPALVLWSQSRSTDVMHGWGRLWLVAAGGLMALAAVQAFRKWRIERVDQA